MQPVIHRARSWQMHLLWTDFAAHSWADLELLSSHHRSPPVWITPSNYKSSGQDRSKGVPSGLNLLHVHQLILHWHAVTTMFWITAGNHRSICQHGHKYICMPWTRCAFWRSRTAQSPPRIGFPTPGQYPASCSLRILQVGQRPSSVTSFRKPFPKDPTVFWARSFKSHTLECSGSCRISPDSGTIHLLEALEEAQNKTCTRSTLKICPWGNILSHTCHSPRSWVNKSLNPIGIGSMMVSLILWTKPSRALAVTISACYFIHFHGWHWHVWRWHKQSKWPVIGPFWPAESTVVLTKVCLSKSTFLMVESSRWMVNWTSLGCETSQVH